MSVFILLVAIVALYTVMKLYSGGGSKLPSASTAKGKQARVVVGILLVLLIGSLIFNVKTGGSGSTSVASSIEAVCIGILVAIAYYFAKRTGNIDR